MGEHVVTVLHSNIVKTILLTNQKPPLTGLVSRIDTFGDQNKDTECLGFGSHSKILVVQSACSLKIGCRCKFVFKNNCPLTRRSQSRMHHASKSIGNSCNIFSGKHLFFGIKLNVQQRGLHASFARGGSPLPPQTHLPNIHLSFTYDWVHEKSTGGPRV